MSNIARRPWHGLGTIMINGAIGRDDRLIFNYVEHDRLLAPCVLLVMGKFQHMSNIHIMLYSSTFRRKCMLFWNSNTLRMSLCPQDQRI